MKVLKLPSFYKL